jgi:hypothetical protein
MERISIRAVVMIIAAPDARIGSLLPIHLDLEVVIGRGEDDRVIDIKLSLTSELAPRLNEADALGFELHLVLAVLVHVQDHLHRRPIVFVLVLW